MNSANSRIENYGCTPFTVQIYNYFFDWVKKFFNNMCEKTHIKLKIIDTECITNAKKY